MFVTHTQASALSNCALLPHTTYCCLCHCPQSLAQKKCRPALVAGGGAVFGGAGPWSTQASSSVTTFLVSAEGTRGGRNHPELRWNPTGTLVLCYFLVMLCYFLVAVSRILGKKHHRKEGQEPGPLVSCLHSQEAGRDECWRPAVFLLLNFNLGPTPQDGDLQPQPTGC